MVRLRPLVPLLRARSGVQRPLATAATAPSPSSALTAQDIARFQAILSAPPDAATKAGKVLLDPEALAPFTADWTRKWAAPACPAVLQPKTTAQVAALLAYCNDRGIAVVPQGGNTGLVGGSVPLHDEVILSLSGMNRILSFDAVAGVLVCEAGCILEELDTWLRAKGYIMPLDLGAKGSCQIGGNVSTNAGGLRYLRYGSLHGTVLGLEVVLADGTVLDMLSTLCKDNTGLDLKQLFIGAEGTLGVVTKVALQVPPAPAAVNVALVGLESFDKVKEMVVLTKQRLGEILSAMELMDAASLDVVLKQKSWGLRSPLAQPYPFYMLLETSGSDEAHDAAKLEQLLTAAVEEEVVADGAMAQDLAQAKEMWKLRELVPVAIEEEGRVHKYDVSIPLPVFYDIVTETRARLAKYAPSGVKVVGYGHLGDSNLHLNIAVPRDAPDPPEVAAEMVLPWVMQHKGSVSAEHGLGQLKREYLSKTKSAAVVGVMKGMKAMLDPKGILNPGKFYSD